MGDIRDPVARQRALSRDRRGRAPGRDRGRPGLRAGPGDRAGGQRRRRARARERRRARRRRALRVRLDLLQLRPHGRPDRADRRGRGAGAGLALRGAEGRARARGCSRSIAAPFAATCLRFATVYGVAPRMRFDLTVNEFTRDLWAGRRLEVFGEQFWRPYVHVRDAARGVRARARGAAGAVAGARLQRRRQRRELPQARPRRAHPARDGSRRRRLRTPHRGPAGLQGGVRARSRSASATT